MNKTKFFISLIVTVSILIAQVGEVFAAPALQDSTLISGTVGSVTVETDPNTGVITVIVELVGDDQSSQIVRVSQKTAYNLGLLDYDEDGNPFIVDPLPDYVEIDPSTVIPAEEESRHPVANALATFFSDIADYNTIMDAHTRGIGFGVIAQALWLTMKLKGDSDVFQMILDAKESGNYSDIILDDGTTAKNWGQLRKAILDGKKIGNLGNVMTNKDKGNGNKQDKNKNNNNYKDNSKDKNNSNNGNGNGYGNGKEKKK